MKPVLHPKVRERLAPRMSATAMAEYLTASAEHQERILHDARFAIPPIVTANGDALRALRAYNADPKRDQAALDMVKASLKRKSESKAFTPNQQDEAERCIDIIDAFIAGENSIGMRALACSEVESRLDPLEIEGVELSVQPDLLISRGTRLGAMMFRVAKKPDHISPVRDATKNKWLEQRREMGRYLATMMEMALQRGSIPVDREYVFVADTRIPERISAANDFAARVRTIQAVCRRISRLWDTIEPEARVLKKA